MQGQRHKANGDDEQAQEYYVIVTVDKGGPTTVFGPYVEETARENYVELRRSLMGSLTPIHEIDIGKAGVVEDGDPVLLRSGDRGKVAFGEHGASGWSDE